MSNVFWNITTPQVGSGDYPRAYLPVRLQGAAPDGSLDTFAQLPFSAVEGTGAILTALLIILEGLTDINGGTPPTGPAIYLDGGFLKFVGS